MEFSKNTLKIINIKVQNLDKEGKDKYSQLRKKIVKLFELV